MPWQTRLSLFGRVALALLVLGANFRVPDARAEVADALAAGDGHTCAIVSGGAVKCWGWNGHGQLGNGTTTDSPTPVDVSGISGATALAAGGGTHVCDRVRRCGQVLGLERLRPTRQRHDHG